MMSGLKRAAAVLLALLVTHSAAWWGGGMVERHRWELRAERKTAGQAAADLAAFVAESKRLQGVADKVQARIDNLAAVRPTIVERYRETALSNPLPAGCRPGADRLRDINAAIVAANAAAAGGAGNAMQADSAAGR